MKIAIDVHGTIDACPRFFAKFTRLFKEFGAEIHITTGVSNSARLRRQLAQWNIVFDKIFSITDYHRSIGTYIEWDEKGNPHIDEKLWDPTKGDYCRKNKIDLAIDDSTVYQNYFTTPYWLFRGETVRGG